MKVVKVAGGQETDCAGGDDFSLCNLPANSIFRQVELLVNGVNVVDTSTTIITTSHILKLNFHMGMMLNQQFYKLQGITRILLPHVRQKRRLPHLLMIIQQAAML